jgi:hypothetical protein
MKRKIYSALELLTETVFVALFGWGVFALAGALERLV